MDRKKALKMKKTPEVSLLEEAEGNTLFFDTPQVKSYTRCNIIKPDPINYDFYNTISSKTQFFNSIVDKVINFINTNISSIIIISNIIMMLTIIFKNINKNDKLGSSKSMLKEEMYEIKNQLIKLKEENERLEISLNNLKEEKEKKIEKIEFKDYASIDNGGYIDYKETSPVYRYGIMKSKKGYDAEIILTDRNYIGECYAFGGRSGFVTILFEKEIFLNCVKIYHPKKENNGSSIKKFEIFAIQNDSKNKNDEIENFEKQNYLSYVLVGSYEYDDINRGLQSFEVDNVKCIGVKINVIDNGGNKKYTAIYKISVFGIN